MVRIGKYVVAGELRNTRHNGVFGWIEFTPDFGLRIELTGNFTGQLAGKHIRFQAAKKPDSEQVLDTLDLPDIITDLADRQIGVTGEIVLRKVKVPTLPVDDFLDLPTDEQQQHLAEKNSLHLEWFSQNGRVVAELIEPQVEFVDPPKPSQRTDELDIEPLPDGGPGAGFTEIHIDESGRPHAKSFYLEDESDDSEEVDDEDIDDPYGLFDADIQDELAKSLEEDESTEADEKAKRERKWEELNLDPETIAMYEQMDEIFEGKKDEPISYLFQTTLKLPKPDRVQSDEEAEPLVRSILAQLALLSVALDVCEHFTPRQCYTLLMNEILPTAKVHPNLAASEMVQHYSTGDFCELCAAEFDEEFDGEPDDDPPDEFLPEG